MIETENVIQKFSPLAAGLEALKAKHLNVVPDVSTTEGMDKAKEARKELREIRLNIDKTRKEEKEFYVKVGKAIDAEAKRLTDIVEPMEDSYDVAIKKEEKRKDEIKQAALKAAREAEEQRIRDQLAAEQKLKDEALAQEKQKLAEEKAAHEAEVAAFKKAQDELEAKAELERIELKKEQDRLQHLKDLEIQRLEDEVAKDKQALKDFEKRFRNQNFHIERLEKDKIDRSEGLEEEKRAAAKAEQDKRDAEAKAEREKLDEAARLINLEKTLALEGIQLLEAFVKKYSQHPDFILIGEEIHRFVITYKSEAHK